jgi:hypothetical protein
MTVVGCVVGMIASSWIPLGLPFVVVLGGVLLGVLAAFFRTVSHAVLSAVTLAAILAMLAAMVVGEKGFTSYLALNPSNASYSIRVNGPNFALDPVLAAGLAGMLVGATAGPKDTWDAEDDELAEEEL